MASLSQRLERAVKGTGTRTLAAQLRAKRALSRRARCLFVTAMPKSGSTLLVKALAEATGYIELFLGADHLNEQDLYLPKLVDAWSMNVVCHQHTRATRANLALMREFAIRPVVLVRDLADALVSLCDHLESESAETPVLNVGPDFIARPRAARLDMVIDLAAPWYLQFFAGWQTADIDRLLLRYEDLAADKAGTVARVLAFHKLEADGLADAVARAEGAETRFNRGVPGRGRQQMTAEQRARLAALGRHFPGVDLTPIGL